MAALRVVGKVLLAACAVIGLLATIVVGVLIVVASLLAVL